MLGSTKKNSKETAVNKSIAPTAANEKNDFNNLKLEYNAELDRRRNIQKQLYVEKDRNRQLTIQLQKEKEENCKLNKRIGALENELSKIQVSNLSINLDFCCINSV